MKISVGQLLIIALVSNLTFATDLKGQKSASVYEVSFELSIIDKSIEAVFDEIESQTDFTFTLNEKILKGKPKVSIRERTLGDALASISSQAKLNFRQVNELIAVNEPKGDKSKPVEVIIYDKTLQGKVTDENGDPLIGATVRVPGTLIGAITDVDGKFSISIPDDAEVLQVSYTGFKTQEIVIGNRTTFDVSLESDISSLDEVIVVGYGTTRFQDLSESVSQIGSSTISQYAGSSVEESLVGTIPGVQLIQTSGAPGAGVSIRVRGVTSIAGGNEPLLVVDGLPLFNSDVSEFNGLSSINPNDIESIEVLKDASATAIYGSRGSNGVVLITTKSGKGSEPSISYNSWFRIDQAINEINVMSGSQFESFVNDYTTNSGLSETPGDAANVLRGTNTDWQNEITDNAFSQNHNLIFTGGTNKGSYYFSLEYLNQEGIVTNSDFERFSVRSNFTKEFNERINLVTSVNLSRSVQNGIVPAQNNNTFSISKTAVGSALLAAPTLPVFDENGEYSQFDAFYENPVLYVDQVLDQNIVDRILSSFTIEAEIFNGLTNNTRVGIDFTSAQQDRYFPTTFEVVGGGQGLGSLENSRQTNLLFENFFSYKNYINEDLFIDAVAGFSFQQDRLETAYIEGTGFLSDDLQNNAIQAASSTAVPVNFTTEQSIASFFTRGKAVFKDRYILGASFRQDGASVFSENNKVASFYSISGAWRLINEDFFGASVFSDLKLRASHGESGNPAIQPYQSLPLGELVSTSQGSGTGLSVGLAPNLPNTELTWETTTQTDIGLDFGFLNQRITGSLDYYIKETEGALATSLLAPSSGFAEIVSNAGGVENRGFEIYLDATLVDNNEFNINVGLNYAINNNEVTSTQDGQDVTSTLSDSNGGGELFNVIREGEELASFLTYQHTGFDEQGQPTYLDVNSDGLLNSEDYLIVGSPFADVLYGINTTVTYKNFSLYANFQGEGGREIYNATLFELTDPLQLNSNKVANFNEFHPNPSSSSVHRSSDRFVEDASFFRLRTLRIGYDIPVKQSFIKKLNTYVSGQNLFTITDYSGYDPAVNSFNGTSLNQGIDLSAYPLITSYTFGINATF